MEEKAVVGDKRFGDEESNLLDQFERMAFEAHLKRAMLGRTLSLSHLEPRLATSPTNTTPAKQRRRVVGPGFHSVLNKLLNPILGINTKNSGSRKRVPIQSHLKHPLSWKAFTRSLRF